MKHQHVHTIMVLMIFLSLTGWMLLAAENFLGDSLVGYTVVHAETDDASGKEKIALYVLGGAVLLLLTFYSVLVWKDYF